MSDRSGTNVRRWASLALAIVTLDAALTFRNVWPTPAIWWYGDLSIEAAVGVLLLLLASRRLQPPSRFLLRSLSAIGVVLVVGRYAEVTSPALYGREVNLYWDIRYVPAVAAMLARVASWWMILL